VNLTGADRLGISLEPGIGNAGSVPREYPVYLISLDFSGSAEFSMEMRSLTAG